MLFSIGACLRALQLVTREIIIARARALPIPASRPELLTYGSNYMSQLTAPTALQWVFDPSAGVGCGLNLLGLFSSSRWPAHVVLGWSLSKGLWKWLGAQPPAKLSVPIDVKARRSRHDMYRRDIAEMCVPPPELRSSRRTERCVV